MRASIAVTVVGSRPRPPIRWDNIADPVPKPHTQRAGAAHSLVRTITVAIALTLVLAATAHAKPFEGMRPQHVNAGPWRELVTLSVAYWSQRGHQTECRTVKVWTFADSGVAGAAPSPACHIGLDRGYLKWLRAHITLADPDMSQALFSAACLVVAHEYGHALGLRFADNPNDPFHDPDPASIMNAHAGTPPPECNTWSQATWRRFVPLTWRVISPEEQARHQGVPAKPAIPRGARRCRPRKTGPADSSRSLQHGACSCRRHPRPSRCRRHAHASMGAERHGHPRRAR